MRKRLKGRFPALLLPMLSLSMQVQPAGPAPGNRALDILEERYTLFGFTPGRPVSRPWNCLPCRRSKWGRHAVQTP